MPRSQRRSARQAAARARSENDAGSVSSHGDSVADSWAGQMEAEDRGQGAANLNAPGAAAANMQPAVRLGRGGARLFPMQAQGPQTGYTNPPVQSPDALAVTSVFPLTKMVRSQDEASRMLRADLDRWHQHGKFITSSLKIAPFGEIPMTPDAQQKLLVWLKNTAAALVAFRATSLEHEDIIVQKLTDAILPSAKLTWEAAVDSATLERPLTGARRGVGTASLTWRVLRAFLRCYDNPHGKEELDQRLDNWKWAKTIPETQTAFNEMVHIWTQAAQQTATLDFAHQVAMPTQHAILDQIVKKMPPWAAFGSMGPWNLPPSCRWLTQEPGQRSTPDEAFRSMRASRSVVVPTPATTPDPVMFGPVNLPQSCRYLMQPPRQPSVCWWRGVTLSTMRAGRRVPAPPPIPSQHQGFVKGPAAKG
jgi:hypothetical protein